MDHAIESEQKARRNRPVFEWLLLSAVLAGCCALYLQNLNSPYITLFDESVHVNIIENLADHCCTPHLHRSPAVRSLEESPADGNNPPGTSQSGSHWHGIDYRNWANNTTWLHKPLLTFYLSAALYRLSGGALWGLRLSGVLFALLNAATLFWIGCKFFSKRTGLFAAAIFGLNPYTNQLVHGQAFAGFPDLALSLAITLAMSCVLYWMRYKSAAALRWMGVAVAFGYLCKSGVALGPFAVVAIVMLVAGTYRDLLRLLPSFAIFAVLALPERLYWHLHQPMITRYENSMQLRLLYTVVDGWGGGWSSYVALYLPMMLTWAFIPLSYFSVGWAVSRVKPLSAEFVLAVWALVYFVGFSLAATKVENFMFGILPAFALLIPRTLEVLHARKQHALVLALCLTSLSMFALLHLAVRFAHPGRFALLASVVVFLAALGLFSLARFKFDVLTSSVAALTVAILLILYIHEDLRDNTVLPPDATAQAALRETGVAVRPFVDRNAVILVHSRLVSGGPDDSPYSYLYVMYWSGNDVLDVCRAPDPMAALSILRSQPGLYLIAPSEVGEKPIVATPIGGLYELNAIPFSIWSKAATADCAAR